MFWMRGTGLANMGAAQGRPISWDSQAEVR